MVWHFALSINPIMFSGVHILMNGKSDMSAICTASAVLPQPTGPNTKKRQHNENNDNLPSVRLWASSLDDLWGRLSLSRLSAWSPSAKQRRNPFLGPHLRTSIWVRAIIGLLKKPFTIFCQAELKEIQNAFPVIHLVRSGPIRIKENSKRISGNSFSPLGPQNKYIGAASQTLLTGLKWRRDAG